jgi:hypothetical protein
MAELLCTYLVHRFQFEIEVRTTTTIKHNLTKYNKLLDVSKIKGLICLDSTEISHFPTIFDTQSSPGLVHQSDKIRR